MHGEYGGAKRWCGQGERLAGVIEFAGVEAVPSHTGIARGELRRIPHQDEVLARREQGPIRESEIESACKSQVGKVQQLGAGIFQLKKLKLVPVFCPHLGRVIHQLTELEL